MARLTATAMLLTCVTLPVLASEQGHTLCTRPADSRSAWVTHATLAGVPAILRVPAHIGKPPIILWHGFGPPASEAAMMDALPLDDVDALKVYLGLPLFGARAPAGGMKELARRQSDDVGLQVFKPVVVGAGDELPAVVAALKDGGCMQQGGSVSLVGFSAGGAAALYAMAQGRVPVNAAVLINTSVGLSASVQAYEHATGKNYAWSPASRTLAAQTDAVARASDIARNHSALLFLSGTDDAVVDAGAIAKAYASLQSHYSSRRANLQSKTLPNMSHQWANDAASRDSVRAAVADWFNHSPTVPQ